MGHRHVAREELSGTLLAGRVRDRGGLVGGVLGLVELPELLVEADQRHPVPKGLGVELGRPSVVARRARDVVCRGQRAPGPGVARLLGAGLFSQRRDGRLGLGEHGVRTREVPPLDQVVEGLLPVGP